MRAGVNRQRQPRGDVPAGHLHFQALRPQAASAAGRAGHARASAARAPRRGGRHACARTPRSTRPANPAQRVRKRWTPVRAPRRYSHSTSNSRSPVPRIASSRAARRQARPGTREVDAERRARRAEHGHVLPVGLAVEPARCGPAMAPPSSGRDGSVDQPRRVARHRRPEALAGGAGALLGVGGEHGRQRGQEPRGHAAAPAAAGMRAQHEKRAGSSRRSRSSCRQWSGGCARAPAVGSRRRA